MMMMSREGTMDREERLRPLLEGVEEGGSQQGHAKSYVIVVETAHSLPGTETRLDKKREEAEGEEEKEEEAPPALDGVRELRQMWFAFQSVWPVLLILWNGQVPFDEDLLALFVAPTVATFWLVAFYARGNIIREFRPMDFLPTALWVAFFLTDDQAVEDVPDAPWEETNQVSLVSTRIPAFLLAIGILLAIVRSLMMATHLCFVHGPRRTLERLAIKFSGRLDCCCRFLVKCETPILHLEKAESVREEEAGPEEVIAVQNLDHLENAARLRRLKKPIWVPVGLSLLAVWSLVHTSFYQPAGLTGNVGEKKLKIKYNGGKPFDEVAPSIETSDAPKEFSVVKKGLNSAGDIAQESGDAIASAKDSADKKSADETTAADKGNAEEKKTDLKVTEEAKVKESTVKKEDEDGMDKFAMGGHKDAMGKGASDDSMDQKPSKSDEGEGGVSQEE